MNIRIEPTLGKFTVYASLYCKLDSDVMTGGGTDETEIIQSILDKATEWGSLHLIVDGAALIRGIKVHSNTTIECPNNSCGFYMADGADNPVITNANLTIGTILDKNIRLQGGIYNHNCLHQSSLLAEDRRVIQNWLCGEMLVAFRFFGVENFVMDGVTICNQKRFAMLMANWKNVVLNNTVVMVPDLNFGENQDGLHFHGPGEHLRIINCRGFAGDDFIALASDEGDGKSSIVDVIIDGVYLENSDQGIRLLTWNEGRLDQVVIRNVFGQYKSFGFFIQPFFPGPCGNFGNILFENIDLEQTEHKYTYLDPFLFHIGGKIESLQLKNVTARYHHPEFTAINVGEAFSPGYINDAPDTTYIKRILIDGLQIYDTNEESKGEYIKINRPIGKMKLIDASVERVTQEATDFIQVGDEGSVSEFVTLLSDSEFIISDKA